MKKNMLYYKTETGLRFKVNPENFDLFENNEVQWKNPEFPDELRSVPLDQLDLVKGKIVKASKKQGLTNLKKAGQKPFKKSLVSKEVKIGLMILIALLALGAFLIKDHIQLQIIYENQALIEYKQP